MNAGAYLFIGICVSLSVFTLFALFQMAYWKGRNAEIELWELATKRAGGDYGSKVAAEYLRAREVRK